jgi:hypothetical protein
MTAPLADAAPVGRTHQIEPIPRRFEVPARLIPAADGCVLSAPDIIQRDPRLTNRFRLMRVVA